MKKLLFSALATILLLAPMVGYAKGFEDNRNSQARLYNGFYYPEQHLVMKWSNNWIPMAHQAEGEWLTNHWTWYSDDYDESTFYGYDTFTKFEEGKYRIEEFTKMKAIDDNIVDSVEGFGITVIWNNIAIIKDVITIYDANTNEVIEVIDITTGNAHPSFGNTKVVK